MTRDLHDAALRDIGLATLERAVVDEATHDVAMKDAEKRTHAPTLHGYHDVSMSFSIGYAVLAGIVVIAIDTAVTLLFAVRAWTAELARQNIEPNPLTPPYYTLVNLTGGIALTWLYGQLAIARGPGAKTALLASLLLWGISRIYGGGHVVMRQMPFRIFAIMSTGLGLGYVTAGQLIAHLSA